MPRPLRITHPDVVYHVLNRANERAQIFHSAAEYRLFRLLLREACRQLRVWKDAHAATGLTMSVNVSSLQLTHPDFVARVREATELDAGEPQQPPAAGAEAPGGARPKHRAGEGGRT